jgi:hypothetical protein
MPTQESAYESYPTWAAASCLGQAAELHFLGCQDRFMPVGEEGGDRHAASPATAPTMLLRMRVMPLAGGVVLLEQLTRFVSLTFTGRIPDKSTVRTDGKLDCVCFRVTRQKPTNVNSKSSSIRKHTTSTSTPGRPTRTDTSRRW